MTSRQDPIDVIKGIVAGFQDVSDEDVLEALSKLPELADETDKVWEQDEYWDGVAYRYLALAEVASVRRLAPAIPLLLDRACFGDPGEIMRGLRHNLEAIVDPDWKGLGDFCLQAATSPRLGTRLWAVHELAILDDPRAEPLFRNAMTSGPDEIASLAEMGLKRLAKARAK